MRAFAQKPKIRNISNKFYKDGKNLNSVTSTKNKSMITPTGIYRMKSVIKIMLLALFSIQASTAVVQLIVNQDFHVVKIISHKDDWKLI